MKNILIGFLVIGILLVSGCASQTQTQDNIQQIQDNNTQTSPAPGNNQTPPPSGGLGGTTLAVQITAAELASHNSESDCWVAYEKNVFDVTEFLPKHKGGAEAIAPYCGTDDDFTQAFEGQHGVSKVDILKSLPFKGELV